VSDEFKCINEFGREVERWLSKARTQFFFINADENLTPEDKQRLKEYFLETCVTPRIKETVKKHFPEDFPADQRVGQHPKTPRCATRLEQFISAT
jgi:hypothetical protein